MINISHLHTIDDFALAAKEKLSKGVYEYYSGGATEEETLRDNRKAYKRYIFLPRMLRDVSQRSMQTTLLGMPVSMPIGIAPTAMQRMAHDDGEIATARAAAQNGVCMILSTISNTRLEDVAKASDQVGATLAFKGATLAPRWFQLYVYRERAVTQELVRRVEASGFRALVLTVDTPLSGQRWADLRNKFAMPPHLKMANFVNEKQSELPLDDTSVISGKNSGFTEYANRLFDPSLEWQKDLPWIKSITKLPIIVKGVLTPEDARMAVEFGASAIIVSNHGARQLDGVPATLDALQGIVKAVGNACEVYLDGGIRTGTDVLKALSLGARAVFIGRPVLFGLACQGEEGVAKVLDILRRELDVAMALSGVTSVQQVDRDLVMHKKRYISKL